MSKKPNKADLEFLEAYEAADFVNASAIYKELHPNARKPAQSAHAIKSKHQEWLQAKYAKITAKSNERAAKYILRLEEAFFRRSLKDSALTSIGRTLLATTGILDQEPGDTGVDSIQFNVTLTEKPIEKEVTE